MRRTIFAGAKLLRPIHLLFALIAFLLWLVWRKADEAFVAAANVSEDAYDNQYYLLFGHWYGEHDPDAFGLQLAQDRIRKLETRVDAIEPQLIMTTGLAHTCSPSSAFSPSVSPRG